MRPDVYRVDGDGANADPSNLRGASLETLIARRTGVTSRAIDDPSALGKRLLCQLFLSALEPTDDGAPMFVTVESAETSRFLSALVLPDAEPLGDVRAARCDTISAMSALKHQCITKATLAEGDQRRTEAHTYSFGLNWGRYWKGVLPFDVRREKGKLGYSRFSIANRALVLLAAITCAWWAFAQTSHAANVTVVPASVSEDCRGGVARIYDECSDQSELFAEALRLGNASGKTVLILYGAEWCIWCHVFDKYVKGQSRRFKYQWQFPDGHEERWDMRERENRQAEAQARQLNEYVAENFVILHLEYYFSPNGEAVLSSTGFDAASVEVVPQVLVVDGRGQFVARMDDYSSVAKLEIREDSGEEYRGFDRPTLLRELVALREAALAAGSGE